MNNELGIMNTKLKLRKIFWFFLLSIIPASYFLLPVAMAAEFYFQAEQEAVGVGEILRLEVLLDGREGINAVGGEIIYPKDLLELKDISDGNSFVSFWVQRPTAEKPVFAGIVPGGYFLKDRKFLTLEFLTKKIGQGNISIKSGQAFLNDGAGTLARLKITNYQFLITKEAGLVAEKIQDFYPPEEFTPQISSSPEIFDGKLFLTFATQDKGAGLSHYEVAEIPAAWWGLFRPKPKNWEKVEAPLELKDQELKSWVFIKAIDKTGNERLVVLSPKTYASTQNLFTTLIGVVIAVLLLKAIAIIVFWRARRRRK